jgi:carbamoyl-phosphate synthase large subunit
MGFSDKPGWRSSWPDRSERCRKHRHKIGVRPVFKRIDTCAAEFASPTAYMYSTYETGRR